MTVLQCGSQQTWRQRFLCVSRGAVARDSLSVGPTDMVTQKTNNSAHQELGAVRVACSSETKTATARGLLRLEAEQAWVRLAQQLQLPLTIFRLGGELVWLKRRLHDALLLGFDGWAHTFMECLVALLSFSEQHVCLRCLGLAFSCFTTLACRHLWAKEERADQSAVAGALKLAALLCVCVQACWLWAVAGHPSSFCVDPLTVLCV